MVFALVVEQWTTSTLSAGPLRVGESLPNQSTRVLDKAFDPVLREILWRVLQDYGMSGPFMRAVRSLYD